MALLGLRFVRRYVQKFIFGFSSLLGLSEILIPYQLVHMKFGVSSWHGSRVDGRSYLLSGAIDGSEANRIISDSKLEFKNSRISYDISTMSDAICEGLVDRTFLERQEVWNDCRSCKVRVGSNGNLLWEASVNYSKGIARDVFVPVRKFTFPADFVIVDYEINP
ncbi:hypothetical protein Tco_1059577, partial [Tanacetum coccineum]